MRVWSIPFTDPIIAFAPWADQPWAMLLESRGADRIRGRFSFMAVSPTCTILATVGGAVSVDGSPVAGDPFAVLARELAARPVPEPGPLPFCGGAMGVFGYELGRHLERVPARHGTAAGVEMAVGLYDVIAGFDGATRQAWVVAACPAAERQAADLARRLTEPAAPMPSGPPPLIRCRAELARGVALERIAAVIDYIRAGDVYQVNLTNRFVAERPPGLRPFDVYRRLCAANPAPFAAFLACGPELTVASASPERFLALDRQGRIESRPIKGTRPRHGDARAQAAVMRDLVNSTKDRAENLMITDLLRNDIGRVATIGSVRVQVLCGIESFATLHHLVSTIEGQLLPGLGAVDLLRAAFPGGSITGAPKIRAMEIIDELESAPRGAYCGAIGWIGFDGAMDTSIAIRTVTFTPHAVMAQAGGGIVADSCPQGEYAEMLAKVAPALAALSGEESL